MITPQTMAIITRIFPAARRGKAMALWGATAGRRHAGRPDPGRRPGRRARLGVDLLHQRAGRRLRAGPRRPPGADPGDAHPPRSTGSGVALSGAGMFLLVFGIQEGHQYNWSTAIWAMIVVGLGLLVLFVLWQARNTAEPLVPLGLFRDRNFSLANVNISVMGFAITALGHSPAAVGPGRPRAEPDQVGAAAGADGDHDDPAGPAGRQPHRPRPPAADHRFGFAATIVSLLWLSHEMTPDVSIVALIGPMVLLGIGNAFIWAPNSATATRNLPIQQAGAGLRRLQRDPSGRRGARVGRDRGAHRRAARGRGAAGVRGHRLDRRQAAGGRTPTASARRWRPRCCSRRRCWCWAGRLGALRAAAARGLRRSARGRPVTRLVQPLRPTPDPQHHRQQAEHQQRSPDERTAERERRGRGEGTGRAVLGAAARRSARSLSAGRRRDDGVGDVVGCADGESDGSGRLVGSTIDDGGGGDDDGVNDEAGGSGTVSVGVGFAVGVGDGVDVGVAGGGGSSLTRLVIVKPSCLTLRDDHHRRAGRRRGRPRPERRGWRVEPLGHACRRRRRGSGRTAPAGRAPARNFQVLSAGVTSTSPRLQP